MPLLIKTFCLAFAPQRGPVFMPWKFEPMITNHYRYKDSALNDMKVMWITLPYMPFDHVRVATIIRTGISSNRLYFDIWRRMILGLCANPSRNVRVSPRFFSHAETQMSFFKADPSTPFPRGQFVELESSSLTRVYSTESSSLARASEFNELDSVDSFRRS